ncbi:helix-turn-helix domain-containing protein [Enterobacter huaxiensis]|uniref:helix-turn-helix domain-containing protein n=1 Tax=Enterobacter huaxiensis TaxID=2494702 RepID=UPI0021D8A41E|nr:helix-turn-helix domain-containing protein [Enterobacter huaxiensis]
MNDLIDYRLASSGTTIDVVNTELWLLTTNIPDGGLTLQKKSKIDYLELLPEQYSVVAISSGTACAATGDVYYKKIDFRSLAKLQAFIDSSKRSAQIFTPGISWAALPVDKDFNITSKALEYWFIRISVESNNDFMRFSSVLKNTEWYQLVYFLLEMSNRDSSEKLSDMSARYGVSVSHFRRLCRTALGNSTKVELRDWRLSRAIVELMGEKKNITEIAMKHGYSSLSHFSNEVKTEFGVSPRELKKNLTRKVIR